MSDKMKYRLDQKGNPVHKVIETKAAQRMFVLAGEMFQESASKSLDWRKVFETLVEELIDEITEARNSTEVAELEKRAEHLNRKSTNPFFFFNEDDLDDTLKFISDEFIEALKQIKVEDVVHDDIKDPNTMRLLAESAGEINIWTTGDTVNKHQEAKLINGSLPNRIYTGIAEANKLVRCNHVVASDKFKEIETRLQAFWSHSGEKPIVVAFFEDRINNLTKAQAAIMKFVKSKWESGQTISINGFYGRVLRGRHLDQKWSDDFRGGSDVENLPDFIEKVRNYTKGKNIPPEQTIVFLDVDGAMIDNRYIRLRQASVMQHHIMRFAKLALIRAIEKGFSNPSQKLILTAIKNNRDLIRTAAQALIYEPDAMLEKIFEIFKAGPEKYQLSEETIIKIKQIHDELIDRGIPIHLMKLEDVQAIFNHLYKQFPYDKATGYEYDSEAEREGKTNHELKEEKEKALNFIRLYQEVIKVNSPRYRNLAASAARIFEKDLQNRVFGRRIRRGKAIPSTSYTLPGKFKSGGVKSPESIAEKKDINKSSNYYLPDVVRGVIIADECRRDPSGTENEFSNLKMLASDIDDTYFTHALSNLPYKIISCENYYRTPYVPCGREPSPIPTRPYMGIKYLIKIAQGVCYELQILTSRAYAVGELNHDTVKDPKLKMPVHLKEYIEKISWGAHILDYMDTRDALREEIEYRHLKFAANQRR
jgi:hypothetical protein